MSCHSIQSEKSKRVSCVLTCLVHLLSQAYFHVSVLSINELTFKLTVHTGIVKYIFNETGHVHISLDEQLHEMDMQL